MNRSAKHRAWADLVVFEDANAGKALETFLTGKGVEARTYDDKFFRSFLFLRPPRKTFRVQVLQPDFDKAEALLSTAPADILEKALHCPSCRSLHVSYPQMTRKFILPTIGLHLGILSRLVDHQCYCNHCHYLWALPSEKVRPTAKRFPMFPFKAAK